MCKIIGVVLAVLNCLLHITKNTYVTHFTQVSINTYITHLNLVQSQTDSKGE